MIEEFDWLTRYSIPGKFPPGSNYGCLPSLPPRATITDDGDFVTAGLLLEDDKKYICSSGLLDGFLVFHPIVQGKSSSKDCVEQISITTIIIANLLGNKT